MPRHVLTFLLASMCCSIGGCVNAPTIPSGAVLMFYGQGNFRGMQLPKTDGTIYFRDENEGRVVLVVRREAERNLELNGLEQGHHYSLYFVPDAPKPGTTAAAPPPPPATQP